MEKDNRLIIFGVILTVGLIISATIIARTFLDVKKLDNVISVSGSAKQQVKADSARWTGNFSRSVLQSELKDGYAKMKSDEKVVNDFFKNRGFEAEISPVFMNEIYKSNQDAPKEYNLIQSIEIKSDEVEKIKELAKSSDQLAALGIIFSANSVEYYYSKLPELRVSLLPEAIKDAKNRAASIASSSDKTVDAVKSVAMGVVQVMPVGSIDISDYGSYDTSSIDKEVMITVKTVFSLK